MAHKTKNNDGSGVIIFLFLLFIYLMIIIAPLLLISGLIYYSFKYSAYRKLLKGTPSDFWLTNIEKNRFKYLVEEINKVQANIEKAHDTAKKEDISVNKDGRYSARSERGKEIQKFIDDNEGHRRSYSLEYYYLCYSPKNRWGVFLKIYKNYKSFQISTYSWIFSATITHIITQTGLFNISMSFSDIFKFGYNAILPFVGGISTINKEQWLIMLAITGLSVISFYTTKFLSRFLVKKVSPEPEIVTISNIDQY